MEEQRLGKKLCGFTQANTMIRMLRAEIEQELGVNEQRVMNSSVKMDTKQRTNSENPEKLEKVVIKQNPVKTKSISGKKSLKILNRNLPDKKNNLEYISLETVNDLEQNNGILQAQLTEILKSLNNLIS